MNNHTASVHEGKNTFKCELCEYSSSQRQFESFHDNKALIKCEFCDYR